ncbi:MAG: sigma-70 family RNA polymerase sigma factor [Aridibacter famidurans]|nr:sigma-70 family RNA polymerase sigma factor [Aridibacter famidurans]
MSESGIARHLYFLPKNGTGSKASEQEADSAGASMVMRVLEGEKGAFDDLYRKYSPMVHGIVLARAPRVEADDLVQEIFLTVFRKLDTLNDPSAVGGWIASIARRSIADSYRNATQSEEIPEELGAEPRPVNEAYEVLSAIRDLPEAYSETLVMRLVEGMTGPEIAEVTGLTHDSVRVNLHRGMKMLRKKLGIRS